MDFMIHFLIDYNGNDFFGDGPKDEWESFYNVVTLFI